jgi:hypothetical protein
MALPVACQLRVSVIAGKAIDRIHKSHCAVFVGGRAFSREHSLGIRINCQRDPVQVHNNRQNRQKSHT